MVWKELTVGFLLAGAVAALVPDRVFEVIFPSGLALWLLIPIHALLGPALAVLPVIGSMGNGPPAAILWQYGVLFAGIMAFLYADFVVPSSLKINATYYGWRFAAYLGAVFAVAAVIAGIMLHLLFSMLGLIPKPAGAVEQMATFAIDYTFFLNLLATAVAVLLVWLCKRRPEAEQEPGPAEVVS
jgi:uncharacterized protein